MNGLEGQTLIEIDNGINMKQNQMVLKVCCFK